MAKKMLINADMLLATPRTFEKSPVAPVDVVAPVEVVRKEVAPAVSVPISIPKQVVEEIPIPIIEKRETNSVQRGLKPGETRATFIVQETTLDKIKAVAYWDRCNIKDVIDDAFEAYIKDYEQKKGPIQTIP
jgi:hypothetical protein